ncbi:MAG: hypothetical protein Q8K86_05360 [Candidatus Nanopelagicaceae bacterium]|nr:hypothetical protein [Candidatus Nanopelagicaceae bacterium]
MRSTKSAGELSEWLNDVDVVIGARHLGTETPARAKRVLEACPVGASKLLLRCTDIANLKFEILPPASGKAATDGNQLAWCEIAPQLKLYLDGVCASKNKQKLKVVVDLTDADWEVGFFVLPSLYCNSDLEVICAFTSPDKYPQADTSKAHPPVDTHSIRQPPGWIAELHSCESEPRHVLFLGFDNDRAQKFIEHYDWVRACCIAVIGDPAYVSNGVRDSESANALLLKQIPKTAENRRTVPAASPADTMNLLRELFTLHGALNIMLLGTSPMTLGAVWFYLQLTDEQKAKVRFLHDFPFRQTGRTTGVGQTWLYPKPNAWGG